MIVMHDMKTLPRLVGRTLADRLKVMPAVVVTGARQTGKSTLAEQLVVGVRRYASLDDLDVLDLARRDPESLVGGTQPVTLDEVQREPTLRARIWRISSCMICWYGETLVLNAPKSLIGVLPSVRRLISWSRVAIDYYRLK